MYSIKGCADREGLYSHVLTVHDCVIQQRGLARQENASGVAADGNTHTICREIAYLPLHVEYLYYHTWIAVRIHNAHV